MQEPTTNFNQGALYSKAQPDVPHEGDENTGELKDQSRQPPKSDVKPVKDAPVVFPIPDVQP